MKRVVRITKQGKVKAVNPESLRAVPDWDELDTKVARIQVLIPVGLAAAPLDIEPRLNRIAGFGALPVLRQALQIELGVKARLTEQQVA